MLKALIDKHQRLLSALMACPDDLPLQRAVNEQEDLICEEAMKARVEQALSGRVLIDIDTVPEDVVTGWLQVVTFGPRTILTGPDGSELFAQIGEFTFMLRWHDE